MKREIAISVRTPRTDLAEQFPEKLHQHLTYQWTPSDSSDAESRYEFGLQPEDWDDVRELRNFIRQHLEEGFLETYRSGWTCEAKKDASLLRFSPRFGRRFRETGDLAVIRTECERCRSGSYQLVDEPRVEFHVPPSGVPPIFYTDKSLVRVATSRLYEAICEAGLNRGLETIDVVAANADEEYVGLIGTEPIGWPVAPYGFRQKPCEVCHNFKDAWPLYAMYWSFEKPQTKADWYYWPVHGKAGVILSKRVHTWIRENAPSFSDYDFPDTEEWFDGSVMGWYPDDKESAFVPEEYHDPVLSEQAVFVD